MGCGGSCGCPGCESHAAPATPGLQALSWGLHTVRAKPGQSNFWSAAEIAHVYDTAASEGRVRSPELDDMVGGVLGMNTARGPSQSVEFLNARRFAMGPGEHAEALEPNSVESMLFAASASLGLGSNGPLLAPAHFGEAVLGSVIDDVLLWWLHAALLKQMKRALRDRSLAALLALFMSNPQLVMMLFGVGGFWALLNWLFDLFGLWELHRRCCPEALEVTGTRARPGDNCQVKWTVNVTARARSDATGCDCTCCEIVQYVSFHSTTRWQAAVGAAFVLGAERRTEGLQPGGADSIYGRTTPYRLAPEGATLARSRDVFDILEHDGRHYVQDVTFWPDSPWPIKTKRDYRLAHTARFEEYSVDTLPPRHRTDAKKEHLRARAATFDMDTPAAAHAAGDAASDPCDFSYADAPQCSPCPIQGVRQDCDFSLIVMLRPRPDCGGQPREDECHIVGGCEWKQGAPRCEFTKWTTC